MRCLSTSVHSRTLSVLRVLHWSSCKCIANRIISQPYSVSSTKVASSTIMCKDFVHEICAIANLGQEKMSFPCSKAVNSKVAKCGKFKTSVFHDKSWYFACIPMYGLRRILRTFRLVSMPSMSNSSGPPVVGLASSLILKVNSVRCRFKFSQKEGYFGPATRDVLLEAKAGKAPPASYDIGCSSGSTKSLSRERDALTL